MRKPVLILILSLTLSATACGTSNSSDKLEAGGNESETTSFQATILEIHDNYYLVKPVEGSAELNSADQITVPMANLERSSELEVGDILEIEYDGDIAESYPAEINTVYSINIVEE